MLYAQDRWSLLLVFQAMDAAGKDGAIKHVMSGVNPQGCQVVSFKAPSAEELDHDYLWRCSRNLPERGRIGIFNRSYYEEVLVLRVHQQSAGEPEAAAGTSWASTSGRIASGTSAPTSATWMPTASSYARSFSMSRTTSRSVVSSIASTIPEKNWKFSAADARERGHWNDYMEAYEEAIRNTSTPRMPLVRRAS